MKITFVMAGGLNISGGNRVIAVYAERLQARGHQISIVVQSPRPPDLKAQARSLLHGNGWIQPWKPGPTHFDNLNLNIVYTPGTRPVIDADVPDGDAVIATWFTTAEWVAALSPSKGAKTFFLQHYEVFDYTSKEAVDATWRLPLHKITISQWLSDIAREQFGDSDVSLVLNSVDTGLFHAPPRGRRPAPTVGTIYNHAGWKGIDVCNRAIEIAAREIPEMKVVTFGAHPPRPGVPPLPRNASFVESPEQDKIRDIYASCDVWLNGSRAEGFHLPSLEAMACRCPVVSTRVGALPELIQDGVNGYVVPVEDHEALADRLVKVLRLPDDAWRKMSEAALATATRYTWDDATTLFEQALKRAIEKRGVSSGSR